MTNPLSEAREAAVEALSAVPGLTAYDHRPERLTAGDVALVLPGDPYVDLGPTLGTFRVSLLVIVLTPKGTNKVVTESLDETIVTVIEALRQDWAISSVSEPGYFVPLDNRLGVSFTINSIWQ